MPSDLDQQPVDDDDTMIGVLSTAESGALLQPAIIDTIIDSMPDAVIVFDVNGKIERLNGPARALFGRSVPSHYTERPIAERTAGVALFDADGRRLAPSEWPSPRILRGETLVAIDMSYFSEDGTRIFLNASGSPLRDGGGQIVGGVAIFRDVTERYTLQHRTQEALDALLQMADSLVHVEMPRAENEPEGYHEAGAVARRLAELTCRVLGCERVGITIIDPETEYLRPLAVAGLSPEEERSWWAEQLCVKARLSDSPDQGMVQRLINGELLIIDMTKPPYDVAPNPYGIQDMLVAPLHNRSRLIGILTLDYGGAKHLYTPDEMRLTGAVAHLVALVVERERLLSARTETEAQLLSARQISRRMDDFLGVASHEMRTPLTSMKGNLQVARTRLGRMRASSEGAVTIDAEQLALLERLMMRSERQVERLNRLVGDLLDVSRIQADKLRFTMEPCDLTAVVCESVIESQQSWPERIIDLRLPKQEAIMIVADGERIGQVIANFLSNALKFAPNEAPILLSLEILAGYARVSVRDHGPGLTPEDQSHIWERFYQVARINRQQSSYIGLGLGLYICKTIIERHDGQIGVRSRPGKGSTFWFAIPLDVSQQEHETAK